MTNGILYLLEDGEGVIKVGIAEEHTFKARIRNLKNEYKDISNFNLVCTFPVEKNLAFTERFIHELLNMQNTNLKYLNNEFNIIEFDRYLKERRSGYTELFLSNKTTLLNCLTLIGLKYNVKLDQKDFNSIEGINNFSLENLLSKNKLFLKNVFEINQQLIEENITEDIKKFKSNVMLFINKRASIHIKFENDLNKELFLCINDEKLEIKHFLLNKDNDFLLKLVNYEHKIVEENDIEKIVNLLMDKNGRKSIQPKTSLNKEKKLNIIKNAIIENDIFSIILNRIEYPEISACNSYSFWQENEKGELIMGKEKRKMISEMVSLEKTNPFKKLLLNELSVELLALECIGRELNINYKKANNVIHNFNDIHLMINIILMTDEKLNYQHNLQEEWNALMLDKATFNYDEINEIKGILYNENYKEFALLYIKSWGIDEKDAEKYIKQCINYSQKQLIGKQSSHNDYVEKINKKDYLKINL